MRHYVWRGFTSLIVFVCVWYRTLHDYTLVRNSWIDVLQRTAQLNRIQNRFLLSPFVFRAAKWLLTTASVHACPKCVHFVSLSIEHAYLLPLYRGLTFSRQNYAGKLSHPGGSEQKEQPLKKFTKLFAEKRELDTTIPFRARFLSRCIQIRCRTHASAATWEDFAL